MATMRRDGLRSNDRGGVAAAAVTLSLSLATVGCGGAAIGARSPVAKVPAGELTPAAKTMTARSRR